MYQSSTKLSLSRSKSSAMSTVETTRSGSGENTSNSVRGGKKRAGTASASSAASAGGASCVKNGGGTETETGTGTGAVTTTPAGAGAGAGASSSGVASGRNTRATAKGSAAGNLTQGTGGETSVRELQQQQQQLPLKQTSSYSKQNNYKNNKQRQHRNHSLSQDSQLQDRDRDREVRSTSNSTQTATSAPSILGNKEYRLGAGSSRTGTNTYNNNNNNNNKIANQVQKRRSAFVSWADWNSKILHQARSDGSALAIGMGVGFGIGSGTPRGDSATSGGTTPHGQAQAQAQAQMQPQRLKLTTNLSARTSNKYTSAQAEAIDDVESPNSRNMDTVSTQSITSVSTATRSAMDVTITPQNATEQDPHRGSKRHHTPQLHVRKERPKTASQLQQKQHQDDNLHDPGDLDDENINYDHDIHYAHNKMNKDDDDDDDDDYQDEFQPDSLSDSRASSSTYLSRKNYEHRKNKLYDPSRVHHFTIDSIPIPCLTHAATIYLIETYKQSNPNFSYNLGLNPRRVLTRPDEGVYNNGYDNENHDYILHVNDVIEAPENTYVVVDMLGTGTFGQVVSCVDVESGHTVAIKVIKNLAAYYRQALMEVYILDSLQRENEDHETRNMISLLGYFLFRNHLCLVFRKLSINLFELIKKNNYRGLSLDLVRHLVKQIMGVLQVLMKSDVIHCDLKPENILLNSLDSTDITVIDFGSACQESSVVYSYVQSRFYRSPEVLLGAPYDTKIDIWSLGCIAGELFLGLPLFPGQSEQNMIARITEMIGPTPDSLLDRSKHRSKYYDETCFESCPRYKLKSDQEYAESQNIPYEPFKRYFKHKKLEDIIMNYPYKSDPPSMREVSMRACFYDFLYGLLRLDPLDRWNPFEAAEHPFLLNKPLPQGEPWSPPRHKTYIPRRLGHGARDDELAYFSSSVPQYNYIPRPEDDAFLSKSLEGPSHLHDMGGSHTSNYQRAASGYDSSADIYGEESYRESPGGEDSDANVGNMDLQSNSWNPFTADDD